MADKCHLCLLGLIFLSSLLTGLSGVDDAHVFISSGEDVRLPCNNALPDCNSTTWNYNSYSSGVELFAGGRKKKHTEKHERLSLGSDCSLNIKSVTKEDYGLYTCRQYVNNQQQGPDARVFVHVLHVCVSVSSSEISAGRSVTLFCQLYSYPRVSCVHLIRSEQIELFWVNQAGVKQMRSDSRNQISAPGHCIISLNTTILNEDHNREWRCEVTHRDQLKTSVSYTVKISARADSTTAETSTPENQKPLNTPNFERTAAAHTSGFTDQQVVTSTTETTLSQDTAPITWKVIVIVIVVGVSVALLLPALILWLIRKKRADVRRETDDSVEQTDDVTYIIYCAQ
ncbi:contactin-3-like [Carassius gibelio]|uniref:contactin-3-like n=1 Tax=Carassius gibelio TaxID=101364 RepID=UPI002279B9AA|nr:contactin-3-like [Carassius gibelio]